MPSNSLKGPYPPGPRSRFSVKTYLELHGDPLGFLRRLVDSYGDIVHLQFGPRHDFLFYHPDHIQKILLAPEKLARSTPRALSRLLGNGLLTSDQKFHGCQRRYLQPSFHLQKIYIYSKVMAKLIGDLSRRWESQETVDIYEEMNHLALHIVVKTLLGAELDEEEDAIVEAIETIKGLTDKKKIPFVDALFWKLPFPAKIRYDKASRFLDEKIYAIIRKKRQEPPGENDMIASLLYQQADSDVLTDKQIRDEAMTMFFAGHETIGSALTWVWYLLSQHPEVEAKLHEEIDRVLGTNPPTADDLQKLAYTRKVLLESMRLYPPVWLMVRRPVEDIEINGYVIPARSYVHVCQYLVHHDPRHFPEPERFDPERWAPEAAARRHKFSYFPFGGGKRQCIGEEFAMTEGVLTIAALAQRWKLKCLESGPVEIEPIITLRPKKGLRMRLEQRTKHSSKKFVYDTV